MPTICESARPSGALSCWVPGPSPLQEANLRAWHLCVLAGDGALGCGSLSLRVELWILGFETTPGPGGRGWGEPSGRSSKAPSCRLGTQAPV